MGIEKKSNNKSIDKKKKVLKAVRIFLVVMLFFTFFSRTINNLTLPQVVVAQTSSGDVIKEAIFDGEVSSKKSINHFVDLKLTVDEIMVNVGDKVRKDEVLLILDSEPLEKELSQEEFSLNIHENDYKSLQLNLERLESEDFFQLRHKLEKTKMALTELESNYNSNLKLFKEDKLDNNKLKQSERAYSNSQIDYEIQKKELLRKEEELKRDIEDAKLKLENKKFYIERTKNNIRNIEKQISDCVIRASEDGIVKEINYTKGMVTSNFKPIYQLDVIEEGFQVIGNVATDVSSFIEVGDDATISLQGDKKMQFQNKVTEINHIQGNNQLSEVKIDLEQEDITGDERVEVRIKKDIGFYEIMIPNEAIYKDIEGNYYVYVIEEKKSYLGNEYYVKKKDVMVGSSNYSYTGITEGLYPYEKIVVTSNKPIRDNSQVTITQ